MKILTGRLRGQTILFRPNPNLRPTSDKARKAIFDMLQGAFENRRALDLFSGTGALGFEALSQGASYAAFVENNVFQCRKIEENLSRFKMTDAARIYEEDVLEWVRTQTSEAPFDFIFLDPPYAETLAFQTMELIAERGLLSKNGFLVTECRKKVKPEPCKNLALVREKHYGQAKILVYRPVL